MRTALFCSALILMISGACSWAGVAPATSPAVVAQQQATQPVVVPVVLRFNERSIKGILAGTKTASIRKGIREFPDGPVKAVGSDGTTITVKIISTMQKKLSELNDADAKANGSDSLDDLNAEMRRNYPGIQGDDVVTVIMLRLD